MADTRPTLERLATPHCDHIAVQQPPPPPRDPAVFHGTDQPPAPYSLLAPFPLNHSPLATDH